MKKFKKYFTHSSIVFLFGITILFGLCLLALFNSPSQSFAYSDCGGGLNYCADSRTVGTYTTCIKNGTSCTPSGYTTRTEPCRNCWYPDVTCNCSTEIFNVQTGCWYNALDDICTPTYSTKNYSCCVLGGTTPTPTTPPDYSNNSCYGLTVNKNREPDRSYTLNKGQTYAFSTNYHFPPTWGCAGERVCTGALTYNPLVCIPVNATTRSNRDASNRVVLGSTTYSASGNRAATYNWTPTQSGTYKIFCNASTGTMGGCAGLCPYDMWICTNCTSEGCDCHWETESTCNGGLEGNQWIKVKVVESINGVCSNPDTHYICTTGTSANHVSGTSTWTWTCNGLNGGTNASCSENKPIDPWWQVVDGDVQTNGDLRSDVPSIGSLYFDVAGGGGYPGVPAYGGSTNLTASNVSAKGWIAKSSYVTNRTYNYDFFESLIPAETVVNAITLTSLPGSYFNTGNIDPGSGYYWYKYSGSLPLTISSAINLAGSRKVILLVDSPNLYLNGSINYTAGTGFFMVMVKGNININSSVGGGGVADLQGYYLADSSFVTGTGNKQLHVKGSVAGYGGITLQRDLGAAANADTPAEIFEYSPADVFLYPFKLGVRRMSWKEVAP